MFTLLEELFADMFTHDYTSEEEVITIAIVDKDGTHYLN